MELTLRAAGQYAVTVSVGGGGEFFTVVALEVDPDPSEESVHSHTN